MLRVVYQIYIGEKETRRHLAQLDADDARQRLLLLTSSKGCITFVSRLFSMSQLHDGDAHLLSIVTCFTRNPNKSYYSSEFIAISAAECMLAAVAVTVRHRLKAR